MRRPTVTAVVDGLEIRGLVQRTPGDLDKRSVTHTLTPKGQRLLAKANAAVDARLTDIAGSLDDPALTAPGPRRPGAVARRHARLSLGQGRPGS